MQLLEAFNVTVVSVSKEKDPSCDLKDEDPKLKSRVNDHNSQEVCTGTRLYTNMENNRASHVEKGLGYVPSKSAGTQWNLSMVTEENFPVQAHHLIPKNFLPDHKVCRWLAIKYKKDPLYELKYDSDYDTDDSDNGYCMPYATPMSEWGGDQSKKTAVAFKVMEKTGVQLHQGSHATVLDAAKMEAMAGEAIIPTIVDSPGGGDPMEEAKIHHPGYLNRVKILLNVVDAKALAHAKKCPVCQKNKEGGKIKVLPMKEMTTLMHRVSKIIKLLLKADVMHASGYAYYYAHHKRHLEVRDGRIHVRGTRAELTASLAK
jgi:hypothetical protein